MENLSSPPGYRNHSPTRDTPLHRIGFALSPRFASNDHQVRILVDEEDWLGDSGLGIDPPEFFAQPALTISGELLVGRCVTQS